MFEEYTPSDMTLKGYAANIISEKYRSIKNGNWDIYKRIIKQYYKGLSPDASAKLSSFIR